MKTKKIFILISSLFLFVMVVTVVKVVNSPEKKVMRYFASNREILQENVLNYAAENQVSDVADIKASYWNGEHPIIEYTIENRGFASASQYYGVFYSFDDVPVAFQNTNTVLVPLSDEKWEWSEGGDNKGYIRKIESNWFYFEATF